MDGVMHSKTMAFKKNAWVGDGGQIFLSNQEMCQKIMVELEFFADASEQNKQVSGTENGTGPIPGQSTDWKWVS